MDNMLTENEDAASITVDARVLTDSHTHTHTHTNTQTDRHDQLYDSRPSLFTIFVFGQMIRQKFTISTHQTVNERNIEN